MQKVFAGLVRKSVVIDLTGITESGLRQLWIQLQLKKLPSVLVCVVYRPPDIGLSCLENDLMPKYIQAL